MTWSVRFAPGAQRELDALDRPIAERMRRALLRLAQDPLTAPNVIAMAGGGYRMRVGDWRAIYALQADALIILVLRIAHRREVYR